MFKVLELVFAVIMVAVVVAAVILQYKLFAHWHKNCHIRRICIYMLATIPLLWLGFTGMLALAVYLLKLKSLNKELYDDREGFYEVLENNPSVKRINALMEYLDEHGFPNHPYSWGQLRKVWRACMRSDKIPEEKKIELYEFLMKRGLHLGRKDTYFGSNSEK